MQCFEQLAAIAKFAGQPVKQLGMSRFGSHPSEVIRRRDDALSEVILPDAIHDRTPDQRVIRSRQPASQLRATL